MNDAPPCGSPYIGGYIDAACTVRAAKRAGLSLCDYVESLWDQKGATTAVIDNMSELGCFESINTVLEIGPGTGRYLEKVFERAVVHAYEIYEPAMDWANYLDQAYGSKIVTRQSDGETLAATLSDSMDLVHGHGVFVYLPAVQSFSYFSEIARVCRDGGFVVFDFYSEEEMTLSTVDRWVASRDRYPVFLPGTVVARWFQKYGLFVVGQFTNTHGQGHSRYLVLRKQR